MSAKRIERLLEKATSPSLLEPDWESTFIFVDGVRSAEIPVKLALSSVKKRYHNKNPHVSFYALCVLESLVKNCGDKVAKEIATKEYMEDLKHMAADAPAEKVKHKILELIACWARVFQKKSEFKIVQDTYNLMKMEGFEFPSIAESQAMFDAESAPEWKDATLCSRCNTGFSLIVRKHHCRNCGDIYCDKCSSKSKHLPHLGIEREVRVCEGCFDKLNTDKQKGGAAGPGAKGAGKGQEGPGQAEQAEKERKLKEQKSKEEEELQLALAISQSQAEEEERQKQRHLLNLYNGPDSQTAADSAPPSFAYKGAKDENRQPEVSPGPETVEVPADNPELARYLNRGYWEQKRTEQKQSILRQSPTPSAPPPTSEPVQEKGQGPGPDTDLMPKAPAVNGVMTVTAQPPYQDNSDTTQFAGELKKQVDVFVNRIKSDQARGRSVVMDSSIQSLFLTLTNLHTNVLHRMHTLDENRAQQESLQDRLAHIQDARQAVNALREEHERQRQAMLAEAQRQKQLQMQEKLGLMRQKKHEMLEHQRMMAVQRMQQHEAELAMRRHMQAQYAAMPAGMAPGQVPQAQPGMYDSMGQPIQYAYQQQHQSPMYTTAPGHVPGQMPAQYAPAPMMGHGPPPQGPPQHQQGPIQQQGPPQHQQGLVQQQGPPQQQQGPPPQQGAPQHQQGPPPPQGPPQYQPGPPHQQGPPPAYDMQTMQQALPPNMYANQGPPPPGYAMYQQYQGGPAAPPAPGPPPPPAPQPEAVEDQPLISFD